VVTAASARAVGYPQRCHGLAHDIFAQDRTERGTAVPPARERRRPRALKLDVVTPPIASHHLAQQVGASVAESRNEMPELMPGIGQRQRFGSIGYAVARKDLHALCACQRVRIESQAACKLNVQLHQARGCHGRWAHTSVERPWQSRIGIFEAEMDGLAIGREGRRDSGRTW
jgi:hypothetical protein